MGSYSSDSSRKFPVLRDSSQSLLSNLRGIEVSFDDTTSLLIKECDSCVVKIAFDFIDSTANLQCQLTTQLVKYNSQLCLEGLPTNQMQHVLGLSNVMVAVPGWMWHLLVNSLHSTLVNVA